MQLKMDRYRPETGRGYGEGDNVINWIDLLNAANCSALAFQQGRRFRVNHVISLTNNDPYYIQFVVTGNVDLIFARQTIVDGSADYEVFTSAQASGATGFTTPVPVYPTNSKSGVPAPASVVSLNVGGTVTLTGTPNTTTFLRSGGPGDKGINNPVTDDFPRGFPATTVYVRITRNGAQTANLVLEYEFNQE